MLPLDKYRLLVQLFLLVIDFCNLVLLAISRNSPRGLFYTLY